MSQQKEHNNYAPGYRPSELGHHEWRTAENSAPHLLPLLPDLLKRFPSLKLLDVGAGSGTITSSLARHLPPPASLVATDLSPEILTRARELAAPLNLPNITYQPGSVYALPFQDGQFQVTHASQVLCHLDDPVGAIKEMVRVTGSGGVVAIRESDMRGFTIYPEEIQGSNMTTTKAFELTGNVIQSAGGWKDGGRRLVHWALEAGVQRENITFTWGNWTFCEPGDRRVWAGAHLQRLQTGDMRTRAVEKGLASDAELDEMMTVWEKWMNCEDGTFGLMQGELIIRVP